MKPRNIILLLSFFFAVGIGHVQAQGRQYTEQSPLVYEDSWSMWPFSFINDNGKPDGFNVELVQDVMRRLRIPLTIRLCSAQSAREDLHHDNANLFVGMKNNYNANFGQFGNSVIVTVTTSMITSRKDSLPYVSLPTLEQMHFAVRKGSFAHTYLERRALCPNMVAMDNIDVVVREISIRDSGAVVWRTASLAWLRDRYHLDNLVLSDVDLPKEELHFMSNDENLLHRVDSALEVIRADGMLAELESKWFHIGDSHRHDNYNWSGMAIILAVFIGFIVVIHSFVYYYRRRMVRRLEDTIAQMQLTLTASHAKVWAYDPFGRSFSWMNNKGETADEYSEEEFRRFYPDNESDIILTNVHKFLEHHLAPITVEVHGYSLTEPQKIIPLQVHMEAMRTEYKRIYLIVGVQHLLEK